jgi:hypothetical protein
VSEAPAAGGFPLSRVAEERKRQPERADYGDEQEPRCPVCGEVLVSDRDQLVCPRGHLEPAADEAAEERRQSRSE